MNQTYFTNTFLFQEKYESGVEKWWLIDEDLNKDDDWFVGLERFNNFPSFNNLSFEDIIVQKFLNNDDSDDNSRRSFHNDMNKESLLIQDNEYLRVKNEKEFENLCQGLSKVNEISGDKTTHIESTLKQGSNVFEKWDIKNKIEALNHEDTQNNFKLKDEESITEKKDSNSVLKKIEEEEKEEIFEINNDLERAVNEINPGKIPFRRWGKDKDKLAFKMLQDICKESEINFLQFIKVDESEIIDEYAQIFINEIYSNIIERIANEFGWMRRPIHLFYRFKKIFSQANSLSVREVKLLKQFIPQNSSQPIDYTLIKFHFPCKSESATPNN